MTSLNNYFSNIAEDILKTNKQPVLKAFDKFLINPLSNSFVFEPCDPGEVKLLINELNPTKSTGPNGIPTKILQMISNIICTPLSKIFNISVPSGTHPEKLKHCYTSLQKRITFTNIKLQTHFTFVKSE